MELAAPFGISAERAGLPRVEVAGGRRSQAKAKACIQYALGMEGSEGKGMGKKAFVELFEMIVPKWDRGNV